MADQLMQIDLDEVLREKAPKKSKYVPRFLMNYLKRIVHQDRLNEFIRYGDGRIGVDYLKAMLEYTGVTVKVEGLENIPSDLEPSIFVCNHPLGAIDGVGVGYALGSYFDGKIRYMVNDLLMNLPGFAPLCIPINKTGHQSRKLPEQVREELSSDNHLILFPAGVCSRRKHGLVRDLPWGKQFIVQAQKMQRDVVPMYFSGCNSNFFYRLATIREALGIKFNIEMLFLVDELFRNEGKTFTLTIGKPIPYTTFTKDKKSHEWAQYVRNIVYGLSEK